MFFLQLLLPFSMTFLMKFSLLKTLRYILPIELILVLVIPSNITPLTNSIYICKYSFDIVI